MSKIAIVTDSTANIPVELIKNYPVYTTPLQVLWDEKVLLDGIDIKTADFYSGWKHENHAFHISGHSGCILDLV
jgi:fatty acid-binding protein DegV